MPKRISQMMRIRGARGLVLALHEGPSMRACRLVTLAAFFLSGTIVACGGAARVADPGDGSATGRACAAAGDGSAGATPIPLGSYSQCTGGATYFSATAVNSAGGDPTGTLTLTETNGLLNVALGEGLFAIGAGTLALQPTSGSTAVVATGQSITLLDVGCGAATTAAGALVVDGNELQLSTPPPSLSPSMAAPTPSAIPSSGDRAP
jgi:hypothetical protein